MLTGRFALYLTRLTCNVCERAQRGSIANPSYKTRSWDASFLAYLSPRPCLCS